VFVADASVWVSALISTDVNFTTSRRWIHQQVVSNIILAEPRILAAEVGGSVARNLSSPDGERAIRFLRGLSLVHFHDIDDNLDTMAADVAVRLRMRGADSVYVALAQYLGVPLITWDKEMKDKARTIITTEEPA
jgi:predicted nucleic acid-binding protein